nr:Palmitoyltransferase zdhhc2 [Polyrhizophydium stewartii]
MSSSRALVIRAVGAFPVLFLAAIIVVLLAYHGLLVMFVWSYWRVVVADPGSPRQQLGSAPDAPSLPVPPLAPLSLGQLAAAGEEAESLTAFYNREGAGAGAGSNGGAALQAPRLQDAGRAGADVGSGGLQDIEQGLGAAPPPWFVSHEVKRNGQPRFCAKCGVFKPDRCHHCSVCERCTLKMDHHCPWVNNCVGFGNYKYFLLFLFYGTAYCLFVFLVSLFRIWSPLTGAVDVDAFMDLHGLLLVFVAGTFSICMIIFASLHAYYVAINATTIEVMEGGRLVHINRGIFRVPPNINIYSLGMRRNLEQVFGRDRWLWLLPVPSTLGDGFTFPLNQDQLDRLE